MARGENLRDYLYVSRRKIARMAQTLRPEVFARLKQANMKLGPVEAGLELADYTQKEAIALVPKVERALQETTRIRYFTEPDLEVGHWFMAEALPMVYCVPGVTGTVLFYGEEGTQLLLGGSAEFLLDRRVAENPRWEWGHGASTLFGIRYVLSYLAKDDEERERAVDSRSDPLRSRDIHDVERIKAVLGDPSEPLTLLARCLDIRKTGETVQVLGSPLYVAFHAPD